MVTAGLNAGSSVPPVTDRDESDASLLRGGGIGGGGVLPPPPPQAAIKMAQATNTMTLLTDFMLYYLSYRQLGDLGVLRGVIRGFSKEARTRGFPSPSFGGFGFVVPVVQA